MNKIDASDDRYGAILRYWRENGKPRRFSWNDNFWVAIYEDGAVWFLAEATNDREILWGNIRS